MFGGGDNSNMPEFALTEDLFRDGEIDIVTILHASGLVGSRGDGRRAVEQGGVSVNDEKVTDPKTSYTKDAFASDFVVRRGKKNFKKITM